LKQIKRANYYSREEKEVSTARSNASFSAKNKKKRKKPIKRLRKKDKRFRPRRKKGGHAAANKKVGDSCGVSRRD